MHCSFRGHMNMTTQRCECMSGFTGPDCSQRLCDVGRAWADYAASADNAHAKWTECSSMGFCDRGNGECACREGFEGAACQYLACPVGANGKPCSDHGKCLTMREAALKWDGRSLTRPSVKYDNWDADQIQGCVCDEGFSSYDCSITECPRGDDPNTGGQQNEVLQVACRASAGYWFLSFKGETSRPIPFDAGYGTLERILEDMGTVDDVTVSYSNTRAGSLAPACGETYENLISIEFEQQFGPLPLARVDGRMLTLGLTSQGSMEKGSLVMVSAYTLTCGPGAAKGSLYFLYDGEPSEPVPFNGGESSLRHALERIPSLNDNAHAYGNATVTVQMEGLSLCSEFQTHTTNVTIRGAYGNLLPLGVLNSLVDAEGRVGPMAANVTVRDHKGDKENLECNGRGTCMASTASCRCDQAVEKGTTKYRYRYASSNGYGLQGGRGDCGYAKAEPLECPSGKTELSAGKVSVCAGRGVCDNSTFTCECFQGFSGSACTLRDCPVGPAWFDEATSSNRAHAPVECSGRGACDSERGECVCDENFEGSSCQRLKCPGVDDGRQNPCSGHGRCLPMWRLALEAQDEFGISSPVAYGDADEALSQSGSWDRDMVQGCHCDSRNDFQPYDGPVGLISGIQLNNPRVGGWAGYDCSRRWCPTGDDPMTEGGEYEVQTIGCNNLTDHNQNFTLTFRQQTTEPINPQSTAHELELILEGLTTIGDVEVVIPGGGVNSTVCMPGFGLQESSVNASGQDRFLPGGFTGVQVTFLTELGDLPMLIARAQHPKERRDQEVVWTKIGVNETVKGTKENVECSNRGLCDYSTGECECMPGFSGSAGNQSTGLRRDCGRRSEDGFTLNPYYRDKTLN